MKRLMLAVCALALTSGCARFGMFSNLHRGETTMSEVVYMLGEPEQRTFDDDREIWFYNFVAAGRYRIGDMQTILSLAVVFEDDEVEDYEITASQQVLTAEDVTGAGPMPAGGAGPGLRPGPGMAPMPGAAPGAGHRPPRRIPR